METKYFVEVLFKKNGGKWQRGYSDVTGAYNLAEDGAGFDEVKTELDRLLLGVQKRGLVGFLIRLMEMMI